MADPTTYDEESTPLTDEEKERIRQLALQSQQQAATSGNTGKVSTAPASAGASYDEQAADQALQDWMDTYVVGHGKVISRELQSKDAKPSNIAEQAAVSQGKRLPNYNPIYRYRFQDNTYLDVRWDNANKQWVPIGGTATKEAKAPSDNPVTKEFNGSLYQWNRDANRWEQAPGMPSASAKEQILGNFDPSSDAYYYVVNPDGKIEQRRNDAVDPLKLAQKIRERDLANEKERIANEYTAGQLSLDKAKFEYQKLHDAAQAQLEQDAHALSRRGQDMDYAAQMANYSSAMAREYMPMLVPEGWTENFNNTVSALGEGRMPGALKPMGPIQMPFDPMQVPFNAASQAMAGLPGMPTGYSVGGGSGGVQQQMPTGDFVDYARQSAAKYGIDPDIFVRQINQESGFNPNAVSPAGATGIAQIMPGTAQGWGVDPNDPYASLDAAARNMKVYLDKYGSYDLALAAYNAGPGAVDQYGGVPPFAETQKYVQSIMAGTQPAPTTSQPQAQQIPQPTSMLDAQQQGIAMPTFSMPTEIPQASVAPPNPGQALAQQKKQQTLRMPSFSISGGGRTGAYAI